MTDEKRYARERVQGLRFPQSNEYVGPPTYPVALWRVLEKLRERLVISDPEALTIDGVFEIMVPDNLGAVPDPLANRK